MVAFVPAVLPRHPNRGCGLKAAQVPPGCHPASWGREAGSCPEQRWDGTGLGVQIWNTPRRPARSCTCVDVVAAL